MRQTGGSHQTLWTSYFDITARQMDLRLRSEDFQVPHTFAIDFREELAEGKHESRFRDHTQRESPHRDTHRLTVGEQIQFKSCKDPRTSAIIALSSALSH